MRNVIRPQATNQQSSPTQPQHNPTQNTNTHEILLTGVIPTPTSKLLTNTSTRYHNTLILLLAD